MTKTLKPNPRLAKILEAFKALMTEEYGDWEPKNAGFVLGVWEHEDINREGSGIEAEVLLHGAPHPCAVVIDSIIKHNQEVDLFDYILATTGGDRGTVTARLNPDLEKLDVKKAIR